MLGADHRPMTARARAAPRRRVRQGAPDRAGSLAGNLAVRGAKGGRPAGGTAGRAARRPCLVGLAALSLASLAAGPAAAVEWIVGGSVSAGVEAETNRDLDPDDPGSIYGATTSLGLDFIALTPTTQWTFETGASVGAFGGDGDTEGLDGAFPNFAAAVAHNGQFVDTGASFAVDYQPVAFSQLDDTGITEGDATQLSVRMGGDASYAIDSINSLSFGAFGRIVRFPSGTTSLVPTTTYGTNLSWGRVLTPTTDGNVTFGVTRFSSDGSGDGRLIIFEDGDVVRLDNDEDSLSFNLSAGVGHAVNARLSFNASLGVSATRTTQSFFGFEESDFSVGPSGSLDIAWQPEADTQLVFALSHGLEPSSLGELQSTTAIGAGLQHSLNNWARAGVNVLLQRQTSDNNFQDEMDDSRIYGVISPNITFSLTEDWALRAGYVFRIQRETDGDATSNGVFMSITRQFDILP